MSDEVIETHNHKIWLSEDGIVRVMAITQADTKIEVARAVIEAQSRITKGIRRPTLVDIRNVNSIDREARNYFSGNIAAEVISALVLMVSSPLSRMIGNFFLGINKPSYPIKVFSSEEKAIEWLKGFIEM